MGKEWMNELLLKSRQLSMVAWINKEAVDGEKWMG